MTYWRISNKNRLISIFSAVRKKCGNLCEHKLPYRVAGSQAQAVERHFMKTANMPAPVFLCCGWDSVGPKGRDGWLQAGVEHFTISMHSDETLFNRRADWSRIPWFNVTVIRYLEMP
ncbi:hypothetical protein HED63_22835 [Ochrobactrum cytisi]|nr:hypothetical protein [Brucella cytisi]